MTTLLEHLNWRYATKRMTGEKIREKSLTIILESIRLSASSANLQPYTVFVIGDDDLKQQIFDKACAQPQVTESSHLLVFASKIDINDQYISSVIKHTADTRRIPEEALKPFYEMVKANNDSLTQDQRAIGASRQAYIALGTALVAAAMERVDASPMEGFNQQILDKVLGLEGKGLQSVVLLALGYRDENNDRLASAIKVRKTRGQVFVELL